MSQPSNGLPPILLEGNVSLIPVLEGFYYTNRPENIPLAQIDDFSDVIAELDIPNSVDFPPLDEIRVDSWKLAFYVYSGYELRHHDTIILSPQCCGDLSNIEDWEAVCRYRGEKWTMLWMGHPWSNARYEDSRITLTELWEEDIDADTRTYSISPQKLTKLVSEAKVITEIFLSELVNQLEY